MRLQTDGEDPIGLTSGLASEVVGLPTCLKSVPNGSQGGRTFLATLMLIYRSSAVVSSVEFSDSQPLLDATSLPVIRGGPPCRGGGRQPEESRDRSSSP
jgi:hypothetical protein